MDKIAAAVIVFFFMVIFSAGLGLISAIPIMLLWDWLMPILFGLKTITYFQAWGLSFLCGLLFKSYGSNSN